MSNQFPATQPTSKYTDASQMPFGKYRGMFLANVPAAYLLWIYRVSYNNQLQTNPSKLNVYIHENIDALKKEVKGK